MIPLQRSPSKEHAEMDKECWVFTTFPVSPLSGINSLRNAASAEDPQLIDFHPSSLQYMCHFSNKIVQVET